MGVLSRLFGTDSSEINPAGIKVPHEKLILPPLFAAAPGMDGLTATGGKPLTYSQNAQINSGEQHAEIGWTREQVSARYDARNFEAPEIHRLSEDFTLSDDARATFAKLDTHYISEVEIGGVVMWGIPGRLDLTFDENDKVVKSIWFNDMLSSVDIPHISHIEADLVNRFGACKKEDDGDGNYSWTWEMDGYSLCLSATVDMTDSMRPVTDWNIEKLKKFA